MRSIVVLAVLLALAGAACASSPTLPSVISQLRYNVLYGTLFIDVFNTSSLPSAAASISVAGVQLPGNLQRSSFVSTYDPNSQNFFVWVMSEYETYFFEIGALNGVVASSSPMSPRQGVQAACPLTYSNAVVTVSNQTSPSSFLQLSTVNDLGSAQKTASFPGSCSGSACYPSTTVVAPMCACSPVANNSMFLPFSSAPIYAPQLYLVNTSSNRATVVATDRATLVTGLQAYDGGQQPATAAIYTVGLQTSLLFRIVSAQNDVPAVTTLPVDVVEYPIKIGFSSGICSAAAAFLAKLEAYVLPLQSSNQVVFLVVGTGQNSGYSILPTNTAINSQVILSLAAF